jgi:hypothetical protein
MTCAVRAVRSDVLAPHDGEGVHDVVHVVPVSGVPDEVRRVEFGAEPETAVALPGERVAGVVQVAGEASRESDAPRPPALQVMVQRLRLADASERFTLAGVQQFADAFQDLRFRVWRSWAGQDRSSFRTVFGEDQPHPSRARTWPSPRSGVPVLLNRRRVVGRRPEQMRGLLPAVEVVQAHHHHGALPTGRGCRSPRPWCSRGFAGCWCRSSPSSVLEKPVEVPMTPHPADLLEERARLLLRAPIRQLERGILRHRVTGAVA